MNPAELKARLKLEEFQAQRNLLGFSHGVDSTALFYLLLEQGVDFDVAMVHYHTREEADLEEQSARELCKVYQKRFYCHHAPVIKKDFENQARAIRYEFFETIIQNHDYDNLFLAHQLDDRLEWFLMQFLRGSALNSLLGFSWMEKQQIKSHPLRFYHIIRPLWETSRQEILEFLQQRQLAYFEDKSNEDERFYRNYIRHRYVRDLLGENTEGIRTSFRLLREQNKQLHHEFFENQARILGGVHVFKKPKNMQSALLGIDKILKALGYVLSQSQRLEIQRQNFSLVVGGKFIIDSNEQLIFVARSNPATSAMPKSFKNFARKNKIPPRVRSLFYQAVRDQKIFNFELNFNNE